MYYLIKCILIIILIITIVKILDCVKDLILSLYKKKLEKQLTKIRTEYIELIDKDFNNLETTEAIILRDNCNHLEAKINFIKFLIDE